MADSKLQIENGRSTMVDPKWQTQNGKTNIIEPLRKGNVREIYKMLLNKGI